MTKEQDPKRYDLEDRTFEFARRVRVLVKKLPRAIGNVEDSKQLVKASGSVGANYREANEALSKKDFAMRVKIARKEAKESRYWLRLLDTGEDVDLGAERDDPVQEATELLKILNSIVQKAR